MQFGIIVFLIITLAFEYYMYRKAGVDRTIRKQSGGRAEPLYLLPAAQLCFYVIFFWDKETYEPYAIIWQVGCILAMTAVDVLICGYLSRMKSYYKKKEELSLVYQQRKQELDYYRQVNIYLEQMRMTRHEFSNQMQVLSSMLEQGAPEPDIRSLLIQMERQLREIGYPEKKSDGAGQTGEEV